MSWTRTTRIQTQKLKKKKKKHFAAQLVTHPWAYHLPSLGSSLPLHTLLAQLITSSTTVVATSSRIDFLVCSVNQVHQSHRRSSFVSSMWVLGLFVDADLSSCHRVYMLIRVLPLGFSHMVCFAKNYERPPEFARFQSCWVFTNIEFFFGS